MSKGVQKLDDLPFDARAPLLLPLLPIVIQLQKRKKKERVSIHNPAPRTHCSSSALPMDRTSRNYTKKRTPKK
jgi:hypothetical protein